MSVRMGWNGSASDDAFPRWAMYGLGRAVLHLSKNPWQPHEQVIEGLCLHNSAYDPQCEGSRAEYAHQIAFLTGRAAHFAEVAAQGLLGVGPGWDSAHLFELNRIFAAGGYRSCRVAMYEKFKRGALAGDFTGSDDLIELDGFEGLLGVAIRRGQWLQSHESDWEDDYLLWVAEKRVGESVTERLRGASEGVPEIRAYLAAVAEHTSRSARTSGTGRPRARDVPYSQIRDAILAREASGGQLASWGRYADAQRLRLAAADFISEQDDHHLLSYLKIFSKRTFPSDLQRLLDLAGSAKEEIARAARRALRHVEDRRVREFALARVQAGAPGGDAIALLEKNFQQTDGALIQAVLEAQSTEDDFHSAAYATVAVFKAHPHAASLACLLCVYENSRCSTCRRGAVNAMIQGRKAPDDILEECKFDSYAGTREMVSGIVSKANSDPLSPRESGEG